MIMFHNIILAGGGLALLLFGIKMMSTGLEAVAGGKMQLALKRATSNRFLAAIVGVFATIAINSSTAVSVIIVGFVNAGLINLSQAISVLLGINVGTTFSAQLIAFRIDAYAPIFMIIGVIMYLFFKKRSIKNIGYIVLGFGVLFFSITIMGDALRVFRELPAFMDIITAIANPMAALLAGFIFTIIVQSSSATMGLLVTLHLNEVPIPFETSAFIILGANIGTSITAFIVALSASRDSKRAALFHITYDIIGSAVFGTLILVLPAVLLWFQATWAEGARQVAMFHTLYNVATLIILIPFVPALARLMRMIIPVKQNEAKEIHERRLLYLDKKANPTPTVVMLNAHLEAYRMGKIALENLEMALEAFFNKDEGMAETVIENEKIVDYLTGSITAELVEIGNMHLSPADAEWLGRMFTVLSDIERISDHADNIAEYTLVVARDSNMIFTEEALSDLKRLGDLALESVTKAIAIFESRDRTRIEEFEKIEAEVDKLSKVFTNNHVDRLKKGVCDPSSAVIFVDFINDLERCSDHAENIAFSV